MSAAMAKTVLIVEDNADTSEVLRKVFLANGYDVVSAADAVQGAQFAQSRPPDIVILDYQMPAGTGASVYRRIRANPRTTAVPVIFVSGTANTDEISQILSADPKSRFFPKPVKVTKLLELVEQFLSEEGPPEGPLELD